MGAPGGLACPVHGADATTATSCELCGSAYSSCVDCDWVSDPGHA